METIVRRIGLVAHDAMKKDMIEWVLWNSERLIGHKFYCTGTTGTLIKKALEEKHPEIKWDITILKSGPLGGDQQIGSRIVEGEIDYLFFFTDPMTLQPHDTDVKALTRLAGLKILFSAVTVRLRTTLLRVPYSLTQLTNVFTRITPITRSVLKTRESYLKQWSK
jgi:Methylglyoxal synthase